MRTRRVEISAPATVGELKEIVGRILFIQSLVDNGSWRLTVLEARRVIVRERLEAKFGTPAEEIPNDALISRRFSTSVIKQWMN